MKKIIVTLNCFLLLSLSLISSVYASTHRYEHRRGGGYVPEHEYKHAHEYRHLYSRNESINIQQEISNGINAYRMQYGLRPLQLNSFLSQIAANHSQDMAELRVPFGHAGFNQRVSTIFSQFKHSRAVGENVAYTDFDPRTVIQQWINSPPHRKNIVGNYNLTGIGYAYDRNGRFYVTQIFLAVDE